MSTVEVEILGDGKFSGSIANVSDYSVSESGSPLSLTNLQGGVGGINFGVLEDPDFDGSVLLAGQPFELRDPYSGTQRGIIDVHEDDPDIPPQPVPPLPGIHTPGGKDA